MESYKRPCKLEPEGGEYRGRGYQRLEQYDQQLQPPPAYCRSAPSSYPPPPPQQSTTFNQNTSNSNVVVVSQPSAQQPETVVVERVRPDDHLVWVLCLMVVCFCTGNLTAFVCLIPALILSLSSGSASNSGDYEAAASYAKASFYCSICSLAIYLIAIVIGIIMVALLFTVGLGFIGIASVNV